MQVGNGQHIVRSDSARVVIPTKSEWYKAAYYNPATHTYYQYPTSSNTAPTASHPTSAPNSANYNDIGGTTIVGSYSGSAGPYGTFDQGGNVAEWNEQYSVGDGLRGYSGGAYDDNATNLQKGLPSIGYPYNANPDLGFRVAMLVPEPSSYALAILAFGFLLVLRRRLSITQSARWIIGRRSIPRSTLRRPHDRRISDSLPRPGPAKAQRIPRHLSGQLLFLLLK